MTAGHRAKYRTICTGQNSGQNPGMASNPAPEQADGHIRTAAILLHRTYPVQGNLAQDAHHAGAI